MAQEPKFKVLKTYMPLTELMNSVHDKYLIHDKLIFRDYISKLESESIDGKIAVLQDRSLVNYRHTSVIWVQALNYMKENDHDPPMGVKIDKEQWMVTVLFIKSCGDCEKALSKKCRCKQKIGNVNEEGKN